MVRKTRMVVVLALGAGLVFGACRTPGPVVPDESGPRTPVNKSVPEEVKAAGVRK